MMTQMCVDATVRAAKDLGYNCIIISDACATKDLEFQDQIIKAKDEIIEILKKQIEKVKVEDMVVI